MEDAVVGEPALHLAACLPVEQGAEVGSEHLVEVWRLVPDEVTGTCDLVRAGAFIGDQHQVGGLDLPHAVGEVGEKAAPDPVGRVVVGNGQDVARVLAEVPRGQLPQ